MKPSVFISRSEIRAEPFIKAVNPFASKIIAESLIDFKTIIADSIPETDWLFFYSQTGADHFFEQYDSSSLVTKGVKIASFGKKTGAYIQERYQSVDFTGDGMTDSTAKQFIQEHQPKTVCIVRGQSSLNSLHPLLSPICELQEMIVYKNAPKTSIQIEKTDIIVFTSPMNLETYFGTYAIDPLQKIIVIGSTTAMSALKYGLDAIHISQFPSMESLAKETIDLCQTWSDI